MRRTLLFRNWNEFEEPIEITVEIDGNAAIENEFVQMAASSIRQVTEKKVDIRSGENFGSMKDIPVR